jgi:DNA-binding PadR family transcriptional regulator
VGRQRNLSQEQIKIRILSYLYHKQEGANAHSIQFHGISGHTQEAGRFKILLEELCELECIDKVPMDHVTAGRVIYAITDKGRGTIQKLLDPLVLDFFGSTKEDLLFSDPQY